MYQRVGLKKTLTEHDTGMAISGGTSDEDTIFISSRNSFKKKAKTSIPYFLVTNLGIFFSSVSSCINGFTALFLLVIYAIAVFLQSILFCLM